GRRRPAARGAPGRLARARGAGGAGLLHRRGEGQRQPRGRPGRVGPGAAGRGHRRRPRPRGGGGGAPPRGRGGGATPEAAPAELGRVRRAEATAAAKALGAAVPVHFLGAVDGELEVTMALRLAGARLVRVVRPDVVLGHDPWRRYLLHPDHRAAGFLTVD